MEVRHRQTNLSFFGCSTELLVKYRGRRVKGERFSVDEEWGSNVGGLFFQVDNTNKQINKITSSLK